MSALFGSYDLRNAKQWRDEDILHREQEVQWLNDDVVRAHEWRNADIERYLRKEKLENEHLVCAARADQLATISEQCTLLCGFTVASMVNLNFPEELSRFVLALYAVSASIVVRPYVTYMTDGIGLIVMYLVVCFFVALYATQLHALAGSHSLCFISTRVGHQTNGSI